jgi:hypothetical protein
VTTKWKIPRETKEWVGPVTVTPADATVELAFISSRLRPVEDDWQAPDVIEDQIGVLVDQPAKGEYSLWARVTSSPEVVVIDRFATVVVT